MLRIAHLLILWSVTYSLIFLSFLNNQKIELEAGEKEKMDALSEAQTNIENEACDGEYVL